MKLRKSEAWLEAYKWLGVQKNAPAVLVEVAKTKAAAALKKATVYKPAIRYPRGTDKRTNREILENQLDDLCRALYKARDIRDGYGRCISCGRLKPAAELQWGHFIAQKQSLYLRWDPRNFGAQCVSCNIFEQGRQVDYGAELDRRHRPGFAEGLRQEAARNKTWKPSIDDLQKKRDELKAAILEFR